MSLLTEDMIRTLKEQRLGFIATISEDGSPNLSPKGTTVPWHDKLVFADIRSPRTVANLERDGRLEINVVDPTLRKGYRFTGTGRVLRSGDEYDAVVNYLRGVDGDLGYKVQSAIRAIVVVELRRVSSLVSPAYDDGTSESQVWSKWERHWREVWKRARERIRAALPR